MLKLNYCASDIPECTVNTIAFNLKLNNCATTILSRGPAPFGGILPPAARRLHHLVMGARALADEPVAERYRTIVDDFGHLK